MVNKKYTIIEIWCILDVREDKDIEGSAFKSFKEGHIPKAQFVSLEGMLTGIQKSMAVDILYQI